MRLKTFDAATMADAMRQIRGELGEDAVIISSRSSRGGRGVRIVAAVDGTDPDEAAFDGWISEQPGTAGPEGEVSRALAYHGVPAALVRRLHGGAMVLAQQDATAALTAALDGSLGFQPLQDRLSPRPLMLVGPPGVGKTTVAAKLIVDAHRRGRKTVAVSCDLLRAGGIDQLQAFTRILGLRLATAETPQALARIVGAANGADVVIDTAGASPHSARDMGALAALVDSARAEPLLVLAAGADAMEAGDLATAFAGLGCRRIHPARCRAPAGSAALSRRHWASRLRRRHCRSGSGGSGEPLEPAVARPSVAVHHPAARSASRAGRGTPMTTAVSPARRSAALAKARNIIAVASGKGGVGKTWLAITLAHALAGLGRRTLLLDGDLGLANVDIQLGLMPEHDLGGVLAGRLSLAAATLPFGPGGFDIVAGRSGCGRLAGVPAARLTKLCEDLTATAARYDHAILDLGAGLERTVRELTRLAGCCVIVTTDEPTSLTDAYACIKIAQLERTETDMRIVVNMANSARDGERTYGALLRACASFLNISPPVLGVVRRDSKGAKPSAARQACSPASPTAQRPPTSKP